MKSYLTSISVSHQVYTRPRIMQFIAEVTANVGSSVAAAAAVAQFVSNEVESSAPVQAVQAIKKLTTNQIIKKIKADANAAKARESIANVKGDLKAIIDSGVQPTFSPSQYDAWASEILDVFVGCLCDEDG